VGVQIRDRQRRKLEANDAKSEVADILFLSTQNTTTRGNEMSNVLSFCGNLGNDAEIRYTPNGAAILSFSVAMSSGYGDNKKTEWVRVAMFGKIAESNLKNYLLKGTAVFVSGECSLNVYQSNDGTTKAGINMTANVCNLVGKKSDNIVQSQPTPQSQHHQQKSNGYAPKDNFDDVPFDDSIPF
jgi:single-strand DNA-binding protein